MAVFDGMRPGEICAIRFDRLSDNSVRIDQRIYAGNLDTPKGRKGKHTARVVALSPGTMADLALWTTFLGASTPDAFLFPEDRRRRKARIRRPGRDSSG
jgi:integrase